MNEKQMAKRLAQLGRGDDTILAHINRREAAMLKRAGGSGTINPKTGIVEFDDTGMTPAPAPTPFSFTDAPAPAPMTPAPADWNPSAFAGVVDPSAGRGAFSPASAEWLSGLNSGGAPLDSFDPAGGFSPSMLPAATPRESVGNMEGLPNQSGAMDYFTNFLRRFGLAKGAQYAMKAFGIPGAAMSLVGPAKAAWDAPQGQGVEAFMRALGMGVGNQVLNQATGGMAGALGIGLQGAAGTGTATPPGSSSSYNPNVDFARGGLGLAGAARLAYLGRGTAGERQAASQLSSLMSNPSSVVNLPGFAAGQQAVERAAAGRGYLGSGNLTVALSKYGDQFYNNAVNTFSKVANENAAVRQNYDMNAMKLALQSLGSLGYGYLRSQPASAGGPQYGPPLAGMGGAPADLAGWEG